MFSLFKRKIKQTPFEGEPVWDEETDSLSPYYAGWSITVGELRSALTGVPDDYEVMLTNAGVGDVDISNVNIEDLMPPFRGSPGLLVLGGGQILNSEYGYDERLDRIHRTIGEGEYASHYWPRTYNSRGRLRWVPHD